MFSKILLGFITFVILFIIHNSEFVNSASAQTPVPTIAPGPNTFIETFDGAPSSPQSWFQQPWKYRWDIAVTSRDVATFNQLENMNAGHGIDCSPPPASHPVNGDYRMSVFQCRDHIMTAISAGGYGMIGLTPAVLVDFSQGEAIIRWDVSTLSTGSPARDFWDVWVAPLNENVQLPFGDGGVDLQGPPRTAVHILLETGGNPCCGIQPGTYLNANRTTDFKQFTPSDYDSFLGYSSFLTPSATRRDTFEVRISKTKLQICMPGYNKCWINSAKTIDLPFTQGVVTLGHHSYNPTKDGGTPNTWHWDNVIIKPAIPQKIIHGNKRVAQASDPTITFTEPAPANSWLRHSGIGSNLRVTTNTGTSITLHEQLQNQAEIPDTEGHFANYWTPVPAGTTSVTFSGSDWYGGPWRAKDVIVWSSTVGPTPTPSPTITPGGPTLTPTITPSPTIAPKIYTATLNGANERPTPVTTSASGTGTVTLSGDETSITVDITATGVNTATGAHIHGPADANNTAGILFTLTQTPQVFTVNASQAQQLKQGLWYINIHTPANPNGEIRGQLISSITSTTPTPSLKKLGDVDGNGVVDLFDFNELLAHFGQTGPNIPADLDGSGEVDINDFNEVVGNFSP